jgi:hypothetical protein
MWHPAALLFSWLVFAISLPWLSVSWLMGVSAACAALAFLAASQRTVNLLRRSRWLLISMALLYLFATPGEYLPGILGEIGLTYEGLNLGTEQVSRLLAMLTSLAILHQAVGTQGLLLGFHYLLKPFPWRGATVVRLMLVLDNVEQRQRIGWREWLMPIELGDEPLPDRLTLAMPPLRWSDGILMLCMAGLLLLVIFRP